MALIRPMAGGVFLEQQLSLLVDQQRQTLVLFGDIPLELLDRPIAIGFLVLTAYSVWRLGFRPKPKILQEP